MARTLAPHAPPAGRETDDTGFAHPALASAAHRQRVRWSSARSSRHPNRADVRLHGDGGTRPGLTAVTVYGGARTNRYPARDHGQRRRRARLRQRRLARRLPRQRHDARRFPEGQGADQPSLPQQARRHVRGRHRARRPRHTADGDRAPAPATTTTTAAIDLFVTFWGTEPALTATAATGRSRT